MCVMDGVPAPAGSRGPDPVMQGSRPGRESGSRVVARSCLLGLLPEVTSVLGMPPPDTMSPARERKRLVLFCSSDVMDPTGTG